MRYPCFIVGFILLVGFVSAQDTITAKRTYSLSDTDVLTASFHKGRREALRDLLPENAVAIFFANPVRNRSNDVDYEYHQNPNFYYLTGLNEPHAMLLLFKEMVHFDSLTSNEIIFVQERDSADESWHGKRWGREGVEKELGLAYAFPNNAFADLDIDFSQFNYILYTTPHNDMRDDDKDRGDLSSLVKHFKRKTDTLANKLDEWLLKDLMAALRQIKQPQELELMMKAINISCMAQKELMKALHPTMTEYQAEAIVEYVFKAEGAEHPAFPSILGAGVNSCIMHYTANRKVLDTNDLLVCDIGAEYHGYAGDVTRTYPVRGYFSPEQAIIYNIVLEAQTEAIKECKQGNKFWAPKDKAKAIIRQRLSELGITNSTTTVDTYFPHGVSHYLGLDVHDAGLFENLQVGMVITVEPGIYIPYGADCDPKWWNIGVRIEDDVLITDGDIPEVLSEDLPKSIEAIECMMEEISRFE